MLCDRVRELVAKPEPLRQRPRLFTPLFVRWRREAQPTGSHHLRFRHVVGEGE